MSDFLWPAWTAAHQASKSFTISRRVLKLMSIEPVMPSNHLILCLSLLLLPSILPSIRVFSSELALCIRWPKYWSFSFSFSISPFNEYSGLISFRVDLLDLVVQGTLKSLLEHHRSKANSLVLSLYCPTHICTWLLEKSKLWLYVPLLAKWCLCFLICCLDLSQLIFLGASVFLILWLQSPFAVIWSSKSF